MQVWNQWFCPTQSESASRIDQARLLKAQAWIWQQNTRKCPYYGPPNSKPTQAEYSVNGHRDAQINRTNSPKIQVQAPKEPLTRWSLWGDRSSHLSLNGWFLEFLPPPHITWELKTDRFSQRGVKVRKQVENNHFLYEETSRYAQHWITPWI